MVPCTPLLLPPHVVFAPLWLQLQSSLLKFQFLVPVPWSVSSSVGARLGFCMSRIVKLRRELGRDQGSRQTQERQEVGEEMKGWAAIQGPRECL